MTHQCRTPPKPPVNHPGHPHTDRHPNEPVSNRPKSGHGSGHGLCGPSVWTIAAPRVFRSPRPGNASPSGALARNLVHPSGALGGSGVESKTKRGRNFQSRVDDVCNFRSLDICPKFQEKCLGTLTSKTITTPLTSTHHTAPQGATRSHTRGRVEGLGLLPGRQAGSAGKTDSLGHEKRAMDSHTT